MNESLPDIPIPRYSIDGSIPVRVFPRAHVNISNFAILGIQGLNQTHFMHTNLEQ